MDTDMWNLSDWSRVPCAVADLIRFPDVVRPWSSLTDPEGTFGAPVIYTEWGVQVPADAEGQGDVNEVVLRDYRWPAFMHRQCEHYVPNWKEEN
jgi:hypothetical protein